MDPLAILTVSARSRRELPTMLKVLRLALAPLELSFFTFPIAIVLIVVVFVQPISFFPYVTTDLSHDCQHVWWNSIGDELFCHCLALGRGEFNDFWVLWVTDVNVTISKAAAKTLWTIPVLFKETADGSNVFGLGRQVRHDIVAKLARVSKGTRTVSTFDDVCTQRSFG